MATIYGGAGDELIQPGTPTTYGSDGADLLYGYGGNDTIYSGANSDTVYGGLGNDVIGGGGSSDTLYGDDNDDVLIGGGGGDVLVGGSGSDTASYTTSGGAVQINLLTNSVAGGDAIGDVLVGIENVTGSSSSDLLIGGFDNNVLSGLGGNDTLTGNGGQDTLIGGAGADRMDGGGELDTADYSSSNAAVNVNLSDASSESGGHAQGDTLIGIENVIGSGSGDVITGSASTNILSGLGGNDTITGNSGSDVIYGGDGDDSIDAGPTTTGVVVPTQNLTLDWTSGGRVDESDMSAGFTQNFGDVRVTVNYEINLANVVTPFTVETSGIYVGAGFDANSSAEMAHPNQADASQVSISFSAVEGGSFAGEVTNVSFWISDLDASEGATILAFDANGNAMPVVITESSAGLDVSGNSILTNLSQSNNVPTNSVDGAALVTIAGPISYLIIKFDDADNGQDAIYVSDINFSTVPISSDDDDLVYGGAGNDAVTTGIGNDTIYGEGENDALYGGLGGDLAYGGAGLDTLYGDADNDALFGGDASDRIYGGTGLDTLYGDADNDALFGGDAADLAYGGTGVDTLFGEAGDDTLFGGDAADQVYGGAGLDTLYGDAENDALFGGDAADLVYGGTGADTLFGEADNDSLFGGDAADQIYGGAGNDTVGGDAGADTIYSGTGSDSVDAGSGANLVYGGSGNDNVISGADADTVYGGVGNDTVDSGAGNDVIYGGPETGTTGTGTPTPLQFNWTDYGDEANLAGGVVQDTGGINVSVSYNAGVGGSFSAENSGFTTGDEVDRQIYVGAGEPFNAASSAYLSRPGAGAATSLQFDFAATSGSSYQNEVEDVQFRISDIDRFSFIDSVTVRAYDAEGNEVPVTITVGNTTFVTLSGNTVTAINTAVFPDSLNGSVLYQIAGPVSRITVEYTDLANAFQSIRISDLHFEAIALLDNDSLIGGDGNDTMYGGIGLDTILGNIGDDRIYGGLGNDSIDAGDGADLVYGDDGNDTINFGSGNDTVFGGAGNDLIDDVAATSLVGANLIFGGTGNDTIFTGDSADTLYGDEGNDVLEGEAGNDTLYGGSEDDSLFGGTESDLLYGGTGADTLQGGDAADTLLGEAGSDLLYGGTGNDSVDGGDENDRLYGDVGDDQLYGGTGFDIVYGGANLDTIYGGTGRDTLYGDAGDDRIYGGAERDTMFGGDGNDVFYVGIGDLNDSINAEFIDGGGTIPTDINTDNDIIDLQPYGWDQVTITYTGGDPATESGQILVYAGPGKTNLIGIINFSEIETIIPCFTLGTLIMTARGEVAVEALRPGDLIQTRDNGLQPLRWVGTRHLGLADLLADPDLQPVRIGQAALGSAGPERSMLVSPQHRVLIEGSRAEMFFGECEVLVPAKHLVGMSDVTRAMPKDGVTYVHILFDRHEIVLSDGLWTESFQPAVRTLEGLDADARREVLALFPELAAGETVFPAARLSLKAHEARVLVSG